MRVAIAFALVALTGRAHADIAYGGEVEMIPSGSIVAGGGGQDVSLDLATTAAFAAQLGVRTHTVSIAFAPRYVPSLHAMLDREDTFSQLDLGLQVAVHYAVDPHVELFAYATPGYSLLYDKHDGAAGFALAFGAGAGYAISDALMLAGTLGYDAGMQKTSDGATAATRFLTLGIGVMAR